MAVQMNSDIDTNITTVVNEQEQVDELLEESVATNLTAKLFSQRISVKHSRRVLTVSQENLADHLSCTTLAGHGMLSQRPIVFTDDIQGAVLAFYHVGRKLSGHPKLVHGGLLAVLLDECMGRACFFRLPGQVAVTAKLEISYQNPLPVESVISVHAEVSEVQGRKAWVTATVQEVPSEKLLVKASGLFIEPKWATEIVQE